MVLASKSAVNRASRRPSPFPKAGLASAERIFQKRTLAPSSFKQFRVDVLKQFCDAHGIFFVHSERILKSDYITAIRAAHTQKYGHPAITHTTTSVIPEDSISNTDSPSDRVQVEGSRGIIPSASCGSTSIIPASTSTYPVLPLPDTPVISMMRLGDSHHVPITALRAYPPSPPSAANMAFLARGDLARTSPHTSISIMGSPPPSAYVPVSPSHPGDSNWHTSVTGDCHDVSVAAVQDPSRIDAMPTGTIEQGQDPIAAQSAALPETDQEMLQASKADHRIPIKLFKERNDWHPQAETVYCTENGDISLTELHAQLKCKGGEELQVLDPKCHRPFYNYTPGVILYADALDLMADNGYLRVLYHVALTVNTPDYSISKCRPPSTRHITRRYDTQGVETLSGVGPPKCEASRGTASPSALTLFSGFPWKPAGLGPL
ncbi:hypothetical protein NMY22_g10748 [Coprinellus aureogranulatus]|nr:hypothetical protein NMY22_g10748 [Coprinellus aureogranulatus]